MNLFGYKVSVVRNSRIGVNRHGNSVQVFRPKMEVYNFARAELLDCFRMISDRLGNAEFSAKIDFIATREIFTFLKNNRLQILRRLWYDGYVIIDAERLEFTDNRLRENKRSDGVVEFRLTDTEVVIVSETYEATGESDYSFARQKCRFLNVINSADINLIENYGAMGVLSPESDSSVNGAMFDDDEIKSMQEDYERSYGVTAGKWTIMFTPRPTKYSKIDLPISQLQLDAKRQYALKAIYASFGIPKELSVYFESTKYANRNEAELDMYSNTVTKWANVLLRIAEVVYDKKRQFHSELMANEFWWDFTGVLAINENRLKEKQAAEQEYEFWQKVRAEGGENAVTAEKRINDLIEIM